MSKKISGILKYVNKGAGVLCDLDQPLHSDTSRAFVTPALIRKYGLPEGAFVVGSVVKGKKLPELTTVDTISGLSPEQFRQRTPFRRLTAIDPCDRFNLGQKGEMPLRVIDLVAPIGKGTRGLIVSPPKAGKTTLVEQIAKSIRASNPEMRIIVLLIDERPEEVTQFRRAVKAEVIASSSDQTLQTHTDLSELVLAHIRTELECGHDVVVLVDSLTRMTRSFNLKGSRTRRTMSGGIDAGALEIPRRFFGLARNIEGGGSVTILATVLVDTGSRMDQFIFEEFKGTGNSEIVLDRSLAEARIYPAINLTASSTRKESLLYNGDEGHRLAKLRRELLARSPQEAMLSLMDLLAQYPTNEAFLQAIST